MIGSIEREGDIDGQERAVEWRRPEVKQRSLPPHSWIRAAPGLGLGKGQASPAARDGRWRRLMLVLVQPFRRRKNKIASLSSFGKACYC